MGEPRRHRARSALSPRAHRLREIVMTEPVFILGGHQTDFARVWSREGCDISHMIETATRAALDDASVEPQSVQSIHVGNAFAELQRNQAHLGSMVAQVVPELYGVPAMRHEGACASAS